MESNWATEHLQVIRTLMERSALYRRALAPIMTFNGVVGLTAAALGWALRIGTAPTFILYWAGVAVVAMAGSFLLVRRQALKEAEAFWSPPTRRVTQALLPALVAGLLIGAVVLLHVRPADSMVGNDIALLWLPLAWVVLYGCAFHAAGFFMQSGMRVFGWAFVIGGCGLFAASSLGGHHAAGWAHGVMGFFFGALHLAAGAYLYFTERPRNDA